MKRGEVWWVRAPQPIGHRPVLLLSRDAAYAVRASITVAPFTRTIHGIRTEVGFGRDDGLPKSCVVNLDDIFTLRKNLLDRQITTVNPSKMGLVDEAIKFALGLR